MSFYSPIAPDCHIPTPLSSSQVSIRAARSLIIVCALRPLVVAWCRPNVCAHSRSAFGYRVCAAATFPCRRVQLRHVAHDVQRALARGRGRGSSGTGAVSIGSLISAPPRCSSKEGRDVGKGSLRPLPPLRKLRKVQMMCETRPDGNNGGEAECDQPSPLAHFS